MASEVLRKVLCAIGWHREDHPKIDQWGVTLRCMDCPKERTCRMLPSFFDGWDRMNEHSKGADDGS